MTQDYNLSPEIQELLNGIVANAKEKNELYQKDSKGKILNNIENYITFMKNSDYTSILDSSTGLRKSKIKYNSFLQREEFIDDSNPEKEFTDFIESKIIREMSNSFGGVNITKTVFTDAINNIFKENMYNPIQEYLDALEWDGKSRVETIFIDWLGAEDKPLIREMSKKWLIAAVKRVYEPGCKFDNIIVLKGPQGCGKSTLCERLALEYYNEHVNIDDPKYYVETINKSWIVAFDELAGINRKELSAIKSFLSTNQDTVRLAYARHAQTFKRHCVFIGSTNEDSFLRDYTASIERRFWVVECTRDNTNNIVGENFTDEIVNQIWAETVHLYKQNPKQFLDLSGNAITELTKEQEKFKISNDDLTLDDIRNIFETEFILNSKGEFDNYDDFFNQYRGLSTKQGTKQKFDRIPANYIKEFLIKKYHEARNPKYISSTLKDILTYKKARYHDVTVLCYSRKGEIDKRQFNNKNTVDLIKIPGSDLF